MGIATAAVVGGGIAAAGAIGGSMIAANAAGKAQNRAAGAQANAIDTLGAVDVPTIESQMIQLQQLKLSGKLTPEQEAAVNQQMSQLNAIKTDPSLRTAQMGALTKLQQVGDQKGLTVQDRAQIQEIQNASNQQEQSNRNAILQNAQQRGMGGSGLEQAAELMNNQSAATNASNQGMQTAAQAQARALQAITQAGTLGTQIQGQDFNQAAQVASAQDSINRFNAANQQSVDQRNIDRGNVAQQYNLQRQDLQDTTNNELANKQEIANKGLYQQQYQDQMDKAKSQAAAYTGQAQQALAAGQQNAALWSNMGSGVAKIGTSIADYGLGSKKPGTSSAPDNVG